MGRWIDEGAHGGKGVAVRGTRAEAVQGSQVLRRAIAFMLAEAVTGVQGVEIAHQSVARDFGENGGGGDAQAAAVAFDEGYLRQRDIWQAQGVDDEGTGCDSKLAQGVMHGELGGIEDVAGVDSGDIGQPDGPGHCPRLDDPNQLFALGGAQRFRVIDPNEIGGDGGI